VKIAASWNEDEVVLSVEDNGPGVDEKNATRIFDPFFTTKDPGRGTGLGLAISNRIIESFGGRIELGRSRPARFDIVLKRSDV